MAQIQLQQYTRNYLKNFIKQSFTNELSFDVCRNPSAMYAYIMQNYPTQFPSLAPTMITNVEGMNQMYDFLEKQYNVLPDNQKAHFVATVRASIPAQAELVNWTTPTDGAL